MRTEVIKSKIIKFLNSKITLFIFAFLLMAIYLFPANDLIADSGDALETWKVVTTFFSSDQYHSYVMYKGFLAFIPNVAFYQLALFFKLDHFFFVKLFNCIGFAYITTAGIPYFFAYIFGKKTEYYRIYILTLILYFGLRTNFSFLSVDFPSIMVMMLALNSVIRIKNSERSLPAIYYFYVGFVFSMASSFSGQYLPGVIFALMYLFFSKAVPLIKRKEIHLGFVVMAACFLLGFSVVNISNNYFVKTRVQPVRNAGEWLPTANDWLKFALTNNMLISKFDQFDQKKTIPDNRGKAILIKENVDIQALEKGAGAYDFYDYAKLVSKYPIDFMSRWLNRLFLGISVDNNKLSVVYLFISYTLLFLSFLTVKKKCEKIRDILDSRVFLILALVVPSLFLCLMHVEMRYFMPIQILIAGTAILSDTFWRSLADFRGFIDSMMNGEKKVISEIRINYIFVSYIIFMTLCFMLLSAQYELAGSISQILFKF